MSTAGPRARVGVSSVRHRGLVLGTALATALDATLDLVVGSRCAGCHRPGRLLCAGCASTLPVRPVPARPDPCPPGLAPASAAGPYDGLLRAMVVTHKEHSAFALARPLGRLLATAVSGHLDGTDRPVLMVPVPSRPEVVRSRGHDPLLRTTRAAATALRAEGHRVRVVRLLTQVRRPRDQAGLDSDARRANLAGSMRVRVRVRDAIGGVAGGPVVVVCDDVLTTGWTAREAQRAVEAGGLAVDAIACVAATQRTRSPAGGRSLVWPPTTH